MVYGLDESLVRLQNQELNVGRWGYANVSNSTEDVELQDEISGTKTNKTNSTKNASQSNGCEDGKDDGKIGFWSALKELTFGLGGFLGGFFCDENGNFSLEQTLKTVAIGAVVAAASVLIPGAGTALAITAFAMAAKHTISAGYKIATAKTDAEAREGWQEMGASNLEGTLAAGGMKATGGFKAVGKFGKTIGKSAKSMKSAYSRGGRSGLASEVKFQAGDAWKGAQDTWTTVKEGTLHNAKGILKAEEGFNAKMKSYDEAIKGTKSSKTKARLTNEKAAYEEGYNKVATETDYHTASQTVETLRTKMETARESYKHRKTDASKKAYEKAKTEYEAAEHTLEIRKNNGEFKVKTKKAIKKAEKNIETKYNEVKKAREELSKTQEKFDNKTARKDQLETAEANYKKALEEYRQAKADASAAKGSRSYKFIARETVNRGSKLPGTNWITLSLAGRNDFNEVA